MSERPAFHLEFERQAARTPERLAVTCGRRSLTYRALDRRAERLARRLRARGVAREDVVGVLLERSVDWAGAVLGVLKAGAAYLPLDVAWPAARVERLLGDARARALLTRRGAAAGPRGLCVYIEDDDEAVAAAAWGRAVDPRQLAYVIYTSGSTGEPKGVMVEHGALANLIAALRSSVYEAGDDRPLRVGLNGPLAFDTSVKQLVQLALGHTLHIVPETARLDPVALAAFVREADLDVLDCTPTQLSHWLAAGVVGDGGGPRRLLVGGEAIGEALWARLAALAGTAVHNLYGPTECTVDALTCQVTPGRSAPRIGRPLAGVEAHLIEGWQPAAGAAGELFLGGAGVARGYRGRPALTAERFVPDACGPRPGARLYRTGDLARADERGELEFLGRNDAQVKLRGLRLEPGEVEAALERQPRVRAAAVALRPGPAGERLVAYLVPDGERAEAERRSTPAMLRRALAESLPEPMLPSAFVWLDALPRTSNGKLDRAALPEPRRDHERPRQAPRTAAERALHAIWREVLALDEIGVDEEFLDLGGHSLSAGRIAARAREALGRELPLRELFEHGTIARLAEAVERGGPSPERVLPPITRAGSGPRALSFAQERVCFLERLAPDSVAYLCRLVLRFSGRLDPAALARALSEIVRRHEVLRTTFAEANGRWAQTVRAPWQVVLPLVDLSGPEGDAAWRALLDEQCRARFDLGRLPLVRWRLVRLAPERHALIHVAHHLVHDGWSSGVFLSEVRELYAALVEARPSPLPELPVQVADFCEWQRAWAAGDAAREQLDYWRRRLAGAPATLDLPLDRPRPTAQRFRGAVWRVELPEDLARRVRALGRDQGVTPFMASLAAFAALLGRHAAQEDVCLGTFVANRRRRESEPLIGMLLNTLVLRIDLSGDPSGRELLRRVRATTLDAYAHQDVPWGAVVEALQPARDLSHNPLFQAAFTWHEAPPPARLPGALIELDDFLDNGSAKFDLNVVAIPRAAADGRPRGLSLVWEYNTDLFERASVERFAARYVMLLEGLARAPEARVGDLPLLDPAERRRLDAWNRTGRPRGKASVHEQFEQRARETPDALAVVARGLSLSFAELARRARRLARRLSARGVGPGAVVGVCLRRSVRLPEALLGALGAGAAYLPLDPDHPPARLAAIADDARVTLVIAEEATRARLGACDVPLLDLDDDAGASRVAAWRPPRPAPDDIAYVVFTSGSTGVPKGVAVPHGALANVLAAVREITGADAGTSVFAVSNLTFDIAALEVFLPLTSGAACWISSAGLGAGPEALRELHEADPALVQATPSGWRALLDQGLRVDAGLIALVGGESLPPPLARELRRRAGQAWNVYGPSETTVWSTAQRLDAGDDDVSIGRPLANTETYVLDGRGRPAPPGALGELAIGGLGLALGYVNRPRATAVAFVPDACAGRAGGRLYRTGDLVRQRQDGRLEFIGRRDQQIKLRGFRIELGEIEAVLLAQPGVARAAAAAREDRPGDKRLVAYVVAEPGAASFEPGELLRRLRAELPEYMLPAAVVVLDALPLTPNGKLDRGALPAPPARARETEFAPPRTRVERALAAIWSDVLGCGPVSLRDDFFALGGHSLAAMQVGARAYRELGVELPLSALFERPVLGDLAAAIERGELGPGTGGGTAAILDALAGNWDRLPAAGDAETEE